MTKRSSVDIVSFHFLRGEKLLAFRVAANRVRTHVPDAAGAATIAAWFERMASGERPSSVFRSPPGRPRKESTPQEWDKYDVANAVKALVSRGTKTAEAARKIAKRTGRHIRTVQNIYYEVRKENGW